MSITFQQATKRQLPAKIGLCGPTGSGKTWTALVLAKTFGKKTVLIDTEHGSGSLYADEFTFDTFRFDPPYEPARLVEVLKAADAEEYETVIVDSLSHFWEGEGGTLDIADAAGQRANGNSFAGWKVATPALRHLVDTLLALDAHLIVTMRSKMEYVLEADSRGKQVPKKVGMAPVMRQGIEYEFALVGDLDFEHRIVISKSRCASLADQVIQPGRAEELGQTFKKWLEAGEALVNRDQREQLLAILNAPDDLETRKRAKELFRDAYGMPDQVLAAQYEEARDFARAQVEGPAGRDDSAEQDGALPLEGAEQ